jgi:GntR family transcriptional regulator
MVLELATDERERPPHIGYLYEAIADQIEERITSGAIPVGRALPNERGMADDLGISLGTARRAVEVLRERGLVVTLRSKGTFVVSRERRDPMSGEQVTSP